MKSRTLFIVVFICSILFVRCSEGKRQFAITNSLNIERPDELIILKRDFLEKRLGSISRKFVSIETTNGKNITVQFDDLDNDDKWDEAAFLYSLKPAEKAEFMLSVSDEKPDGDTTVRAHVRHRKKNPDNSFASAIDSDIMPLNAQATDFSKQALPPYLTEGPAWENDKVGFRLYFDVRNGKDIWGKTTSKMMMNEVGVDTSKNYHLLADWGMDVLKVGKSLGAGALALSVNMNGKDSLVRLGGNNMGQIEYQKIADGPIRAIFRLNYNNWKISDTLNPIQLTEEISIWGGQFFYESQVSIKGAPPGSKLVTGIVNLHSRESRSIDTVGYKAIYTYDIQAENKDKLGMAIIVDAKPFHAFGATPNANTDIQNTYTVSQHVKGDRKLAYRFYAAWERSDPLFTTRQGFEDFLRREMLKLGSPVNE